MSKKTNGLWPIFLFVTMLLCLGTSTMSLWLLQHPNQNLFHATTEETSPAEQLKRFALTLTEKQLPIEAAESYEAYLKIAPLDSEQQSKIYYQMGELYNQANQWEKALAQYYKSKILAPTSDFANARDRKIVACFERLGRYQDAEYALSDATALKPENKSAQTGEILAKIQDEILTMGDLDAFIALLPKEEQQRFQETQHKKEFAKQYVANQVLLRKAKKLNLQDDSSFRLKLKLMTDELLLQEFFEREKKQQIRLDTIDIENYYKANISRFQEPSKANISHIQLPTEADASSLLLQIQTGQISFEEAASQYSKDETTANQGGKISGWIPQLTQHPISFLQEPAPKWIDAIFQSSEGQLLSQILPSSKGFHLIRVNEIKLSRQKPFEEVKEQVTQLYQREKTQELQKKLLHESLNATDVQFYEQAFQAKSQGSQDTKKAEHEK